jgi:hypothetical protein
MLAFLRFSFCRFFRDFLARVGNISMVNFHNAYIPDHRVFARSIYAPPSAQSLISKKRNTLSLRDIHNFFVGRPGQIIAPAQ